MCPRVKAVVQNGNMDATKITTSLEWVNFLDLSV